MTDIVSEARSYLRSLHAPVLEWRSMKIMAKLADEVERLEDAIAAADLDLSPCIECGLPVVCDPDGLPMCARCGKAAEAKASE